MCDAIGYIDKILKSEDDELEKVLGNEGYVLPGATVVHINTLGDKVAVIMDSEKEYFKQNLTDEMLANEEEVIKRLQIIMDADPTDTEFKKLFEAFFEETLPEFAEEYLKKIDDTLEYLANSDTLKDFIEDWSTQLGDWMKLSSYDTMEKMMLDALEHKNDVASVIELLEDSYDFSEGRARRVAITETLRAHSYSQNDAYMLCPSISKVKWVHNGAKDPREHHVAMNNVTINKGEKFLLMAPSGTYAPRFPRDVSLPASESVFCHCTLEAIVDEDFV